MTDVNIFFAGGGWGAAPAGYGAVSVFYLEVSVITAEGFLPSQLSSLCSREELRRDTLGVPLLASPRQITPEAPPQTPQCLDMGGERHLILRHPPSP